MTTLNQDWTKERNGNYIRVGLTGGIGTGKSTVAEMFRDLGAYVVDADELARNCLNKGEEEYREAVSAFGDRIRGRDGRIDRKILAEEVFSDSIKLARLNRIIHPRVIREITERLEADCSPVRIAVIPLLFETGSENLFDYLIVVKTNNEIADRRVVAGRDMSRDEIALRRDAQLPLREKVARADFIIDNNGTLEETRNRVRMIWDKLGDCLSCNPRNFPVAKKTLPAGASPNQ